MIPLAVALIMSVFVPLGLGYCLVQLLFKGYSLPKPLSFALGYGLGMGIVSIEMLLWGILDIRFSLPSIGMPLLILLLITTVLYFYRRRDPNLSAFPLSDQKDPLTFTMKLLLGLGILYILFQIIFIYIRALNMPIQTYDALGAISFKAKVFFYDGYLKYTRNATVPDYPLLVELCETWTALNLGQWHESFVKIMFPLFFTSFLVVNYYLLRSMTSKYWSILGTCLLLSANFITYHATIEYRDIVMMYYNCTIIALLMWGSKNTKNGFLVLAALFSGFACFIKYQGPAYSMIHVILLAVLLTNEKTNIKNILKELLKFSIIAFGICIVSYSYMNVFHISRHPLWTNIQTIIDHFSITQQNNFKMVSKSFFYSGNWNILWFLLFINLFLNVKKVYAYPAIRFLMIATGLFLGWYFLTFTITSGFLLYNGGTADDFSFSRTILQFFPLVVVLIVLLNALPENEKTRS